MNTTTNTSATSPKILTDAFVCDGGICVHVSCGPDFREYTFKDGDYKITDSDWRTKFRAHWSQCLRDARKKFKQEVAK